MTAHSSSDGVSIFLKCAISAAVHRDMARSNIRTKVSVLWLDGQRVGQVWHGKTLVAQTPKCGNDGIRALHEAEALERAYRKAFAA